MSYYPDFAELLDQYLSAHDRSGAWLAQRLGVNPATVTRWRNGNARPQQPETVVQIGDLLGLSVDKRTQLLHAAGYGVMEQRVNLEERSGEGKRVASADPFRHYPSSLWTSYPATYRQTEVAMLAHWSEIGVSGLVLGLAGSGVSTLLRYFVNRPDVVAKQFSQDKVIVPVWLELPPNVEPTPSILYRLLMHSILDVVYQLPSRLPADLLQTCQTHLATLDPFVLQTTLFTLLAHCRAAQMAVIFVIDRIDHLTSDSQQTVAHQLRFIRDGFRETVTIVMGMRITPTYQGELYALGELGRLLSMHTCLVGGLTEQDSCFVIAQRTSATGIQPSEFDIEQFLLLSGGYPTLLKAVIRWWLTHTPRRPATEWQAALLQEAGIQLRLRAIWQCLPLQEKSALQRLITSGGADTLSDVVAERLAHLGICRHDPQGWQLAGTLFAGMVQGFDRSSVDPE